MKIIETTAMVGDDRKLTVQLPSDVAQGPHQVMVVVDGQPSQPPHSWTMADWPMHDANLLEPHFSMRREELYGDEGR